MRKVEDGKVICPIDGHVCSRGECVEYVRTSEQPCATSLKELVEVTFHTAKLNIALGTYVDPFHPTYEEPDDSINIKGHLETVSQKLGINSNSLIFRVIVDASNKLDKNLKV